MPDPTVSTDTASSAPGRVSGNAAIGRCIRARKYAQNKALDEGESHYEAEKAGNQAFIRAMPPLAGPANVRDFVACVTYAVLTDVIPHKDSNHLLAAAKVALAAVRCEPKPAAADPNLPSSESKPDEMAHDE